MWAIRGIGLDCTRWYHSIQAKKIQSLVVIIVSTACKPHAVKSMGAPVVQIDERTPVAHFAHANICTGLWKIIRVFFRSTLYRKHYERKPRSQKSGVYGLKFDCGQFDLINALAACDLCQHLLGALDCFSASFYIVIHIRHSLSRVRFCFDFVAI